MQAVTDFTQNPEVSQLNTQDLCQSFINHHCNGETDQARPYLAELIRRQEAGELDNPAPVILAVEDTRRLAEEIKISLSSELASEPDPPRPTRRFFGLFGGAK